MEYRAFAPGATTAVNNATSATAAVVLPKSCQEVLLTNSSATARTQVLVTYYTDETSVPTGDAPTVTTGVPVLPSQYVRLYVGTGPKLVRTIATAADGIIMITPGN